MKARINLPPEFRSQPFRVRDALAAGVGEERLKGRDLKVPFHGVRLPVSTPSSGSSFELEDATFRYRCAALATVLRSDQALSHTTAARLWDIPLPPSVRWHKNLHVTTAAPGRSMDRAQVIGHVSASAVFAERYGIRVTDAASTWVALAPLLGEDDLVAAADHLILEPRFRSPLEQRPHCDIQHLIAATARQRRGRRAAASALRLVRQGAESRPETFLRLLLARHGFDGAELQSTIVDARGRFLGYADLYFAPQRVIVEYDGQQHATESAQYNRDITRIEDFENEGCAVVRVRKQGLFGEPSDVVARVRRAFARQERR